MPVFARVVVELFATEQGGLTKPQSSGTRSLLFKFEVDGEPATYGAFLDLDDKPVVGPGMGPRRGTLTFWADAADRIKAGDPFDIVYPTRPVGRGHVESVSSTEPGWCSYGGFTELSRVLLEDSWVLEVARSDHLIGFRLDAALLPGHPMHAEPKPGEVHCYRAGWLSVGGDGPVVVELTGAPPAVDATGVNDLGHIDRFEEIEASVWVIEGDWGTATVRAPRVALTLE